MKYKHLNLFAIYTILSLNFSNVFASEATHTDVDNLREDRFQLDNSNDSLTINGPDGNIQFTSSATVGVFAHDITGITININTAASKGVNIIDNTAINIRNVPSSSIN